MWEQPRSQGSIQPALRSERGRVGENPGNEVDVGAVGWDTRAKRLRMRKASIFNN